MHVERRMGVYIPVRLERFLGAARPKAYCDACIARALSVEPADIVAAVRIGAKVERRLERCALCGVVTLTLQARRATAA